jgi:hypothetical protein
MFAYNTPTLLLFPGLGFVALAIGLLARRYSASAFAVGLAGLLALTMASTWISSARPVTDTTQPSKPKSDNAEPTETKSEVKRLVGELHDERSRRADSERSAADADRRAIAETARATELEEKVRKALHGKAKAERRVVFLQAKLRNVQPTPPPPSPPDPQIIRRKLADGDRLFYATQEVSELMPGKKGTWYVVRLLQGGRDWNFADRVFVLSDSTEIKASMVHLRDNVLVPLSQAKKSWRLFVRGAADPRRIGLGPVGRELFYLPRSRDGTYASEPKGKRVTVPIQNDDLPTLRADWLREIVRPVLDAVMSVDIDILENPPQEKHGRTAELVLFVEW